ncbi:uncharacterized protein LOC106709939 isoform X2 [Papilio machaon]|uniref:uncharacterized protein LOC106709939 isoform X2 n=1 Tax=Papilio machaon TaxID=76193 RepID=UPI001E665973|nr:uncharacterized protein LOC106709939 isoform X2 [Papilio machaon]
MCDFPRAHERHQSSDEALLHEDVTPKKLRHQQPKPVADSEETGDTSIEVTKTINASTVRYEGSKIIAEGSRGGGDAVQLYLLTQPRPGADGSARNSSELKPGKPLLPDEQDAQTNQTESEETAESTEDESSPEATTAHSSTDNSAEAARLLSGEDLEAQREVLRQQLRDMIDRIREQQRVQRRGDESGHGGGKRRRVAKGGERTARPGRRRQDPAPCTRHHAAHLQPDASLAHFYSG